MNDAPDARGVGHREFLDLIKEFSEKLRHACDASYDRRTAWSSKLMLVSLSTAAAAISVLMFYAKLNRGFPTVDWPHDGPEVILLLMFALIVAFALGYWIWQSWSEIYRSQFDIRPLVAALERLVSRASQLEDRSVRDADVKVVFVLRISEAESALEYADWVTRSHSFWSLFRRTLAVATRQYRSRSASL